MAPPTLPAAPPSKDADAPNALPKILKGGRRVMFSRLLANGAFQAAATLALPFVILASRSLPVWQVAALLGFLACTLIALRIVELVDAERLGLDYVAEVRLALFDAHAAGRAKSSHGVAMTRMMNDLSALKNWVGLGIARSFAAGLAFAGCVAAAATISPQHVVVILAPAALIALGASVLVRPLHRRVANVRRVRGKLASLLGESLLSLGMLREFGQAKRSGARVRAASRALNAALGRRVRVAAALRALPEATLPVALVTSIALEIPFTTDSIGLVLLAGLAVGPLRQVLRALEYHAAFQVARERLAAGIGPAGNSGPPRRHKASSPVPGLEVIEGPVDQAWNTVAASAMPVTSVVPVLARSLRRNIDVTRRFRGDDAGLEEIARFCGLLDAEFAPAGLDTRLSENSASMTENRRARLSLARALAYGAKELAINAPALLMETGGRALLLELPEKFGVHATLVSGDTLLISPHRDAGVPRLVKSA